MNFCFYAPVKNEERYIEEFVRHHAKEMKDGDWFVFVDTGSEDSTISKLIDLRKDYPVLAYFDYPTDIPFTFDFARNFAMDKVPDDIDVGVVMDIDEFMKAGWREQLEEIFAKHPNAILTHTRYEDLSEETGIEGNYFVHKRCSIHTLDKEHIRWQYPVHECLFTTDKETEAIDVPHVISYHLRNQKKTRPSYKGIIEGYMEQKPKGLKKAEKFQLQFILANEYFSANEAEKAEKEYKKLVEMGMKFKESEMTLGFKYNLTSACVRLGMIHYKKGERDLELFYKGLAASIVPCRETYMMLCVYYLSYEKTKRNAERARSYFNMAMDCKQDESYTVLKLFWDNEYLEDVKKSIQDGLENG